MWDGLEEEEGKRKLGVISWHWENPLKKKKGKGHGFSLTYLPANIRRRGKGK